MDVDAYTDGLAELVEKISPEMIEAAVEILEATTGTVYLIGNGGSAANAEHAANDFMKVAGIRAIALTASAPLTAYANDLAYSHSFSEQLSVLLRPEDTLLAISVSGTSPNIMAAIQAAQIRKSATMLLMGMETDENVVIRYAVDTYICVNDGDYGMVETVHQAILHLLADILKEGDDGRG